MQFLLAVIECVTVETNYEFALATKEFMAADDELQNVVMDLKAIDKTSLM